MIRRNLVISLVLFVLVLFCLGCGTLNKWGRFEVDKEVQKMFETAYVNPDYNYYYSGGDSFPIAIIGLDKKLTFDSSGLWKRIKVPSDQTPAEVLADKAYGVREKAFEIMRYPMGFAMFDHEGKRIGAWYSIPDAVTRISIKSDGTVVVYTPDNETFFQWDKSN